MLYILTPIFCAGLCLGTVFSFLKTDKVNASAATTATVNVTATMSVTERLHIHKANGQGFNAAKTVSYNDLSQGSEKHTIDESTEKKVSIYGTTYDDTAEFIYVGFTVSVSVPAWTKYKISIPFDIQAVKINDGNQGSVGRVRAELLNFGRPTKEDPTEYTAANANGGSAITFGKCYTNSTGSSANNGDPTTGSHVISELIVATAGNTTSNTKTSNPQKDSATIQDEYENRNDNPKTLTYSFGFCAVEVIAGNGSKRSLGVQSCPTYLQLKGCTAESTKLWLEKPSDVSTTYTGTAYDSSTLTQISELTGANWYDATKMDVSLQEDSAQDVGTYSIDVSLKATGEEDDPWKISDNVFSHEQQTIKLTINKATPTVSFGNAKDTTQYTVSGTQDEFPKGTATYNNAAVAGTLSWGGQTPQGSATGNRQNYNYTFTPEDTTNYNTVNGSISLEYVVPGIESVTATFNSNGTTVYKSTPTATLNGYFTVKVKYAGITEPKEVKSFTILGWDSGDNVPVTIKVDSSISSPVIIPKIEIDKIVSLSAFITQGDAKVTCNTSKATLKGMLQVLAQWNYAPSTVTLAADKYDLEFTPVVGTNTSTLTVKYTNSDGTEVTATPLGNFTVSPDDFDVSGIKFEDDEVTYDGKTHSIEYSGDLPDGVSVVYTLDGTDYDEPIEKTDVGSYKITLSFTHSNTNYNAIDDTITATLKINKADYPDADKIEFKKLTVTHDGNEHSLAATGVPEGVTVTYVYDGTEQSDPFKFKDVNESGYSITAKFAHTNGNYKNIAEKTALLVITDKNTYTNNLTLEVKGAQGSGKAYTATYDPDSAISFTLGGKLLDKDGAEVTFTPTYKYEKEENGEWVIKTAADLKNAGKYRVTISVDTGDATYAEIDPIEATLTIAKADVDMSGVKFEDLSVAYDGKEHTLTISGTLPDGVTVEYEVKNQSGKEFTEIETYEFTAKFTVEDTENYNKIGDKTATLTITDASILGITAKVEDGAKFTTVNTLNDLKKVLTVTVNTTGGDDVTEDYELSCEGLRDGGMFKFGLQKITVKYTDDDGNEYTTFVEISVEKEKVALPTFKGGLSYTGVEVKPKAADFNGYDETLMTFVTDKLQSGLNVGTYKAVFALNDYENYEWAAATTYKKSVFAAVVYDGETEEVTLLAHEAAVDWNISKAVLTATKIDGALPIFASDSYIGAFSDVVTLKYYKDEACTEEVAAEDLAHETQYFVKAELLDTENFELDASAAAYTVKSFSYTTPAKELTTWDKIVRFLKVNWLWFAIGAVALLFLIILICIIASAKKKKRKKEELAEQRRLEEKAERERKEERDREERRLEREERMARMSQMQAAPQPQYIPQPMPQMMPQMSQPMPQSMPQQAQPMATGGGSSSEIAELKAELKAEFLAMKVDQNSKEIAANEIAQLRNEVNAMRNEMTYAKRPEQMSGMPVDTLAEALTVALKNVLSSATPQAIAAAPAQPAQITDGSATATQVPPDAVMTTVTTTKIDTTKKQAQPAQAAQTSDRAAPAGRTIVRNFVAPMPVDDGRVFDVGGFYTPADPIVDMGFGDDEKKD
ncbi:MAG: MBG domain-containing protein [Clostridia bacterium]|nr:MBG domain-containing protein [Clostridia bacterium]